jgi:hypothetical protein
VPNRSSVPPLRPLRALVTAAALLHLAAGGVGPWSHVPEVAAAALEVTAPDTPDAPHDTPQHLEERCILCHSVVASALAAAPAELPVTTDVAETMRSRGGSRSDRGVATPARARGPPLA